ncbi:MAG TPA: CinA family nicotinamide mononucleotide deamidase-related protein [Microthrixaceae bacterium]|nr:CinA family nicotinamide mononucleotide deamidase-related protein [Microthrixaceae bacterium]
MRVEVVAVGTELLLGQIVDSNSSWIGEQLALAGLDSYFQTKVGDNLTRIAEVIELALSRSDAVICTGGLGPTQDDLTREAIARVMGVELEESEEAAERIIAMFGGRGRRMPMNNLRQAMKPVGAEFIPEQPGTAPGLICPLERPDPLTGEAVPKVIYAVPGVPWEMQEMVSGTVLADLQRRAGITSSIASRTLRTWGESESGLAEMLAGRMDELDRLADSGASAATIAFLASGGEGLKVRLTAKAATAEGVADILAAEEQVVRGLLGGLVFGVDDDTMESVVLDLLRERGMTLGVAESLTGGMVGSRLCDVPGASDVFRGSVVSYASDVKFELLGVPEGPVVTEDAARAMALGARRVLRTDVGIAVTGVAGPERQEDRPAGTVCLAVAIGEPGSAGQGECLLDSIEVRLPGRRRQVREFSVISLLGLLRRHLLEI